MIPATKIRQGMVIVHNGELYRVMQATHHTPGNLRAMMQTKMRSLKTGIQIEYRFSSSDKVEKAELEEHEMEYLYSDGDHHHFMNTESYEQVALSDEVLGDDFKYLKPNCRIKVTFYDGQPVGLDLPKTMTFKVVEADASMKRATASAQYKNATLENGLVVRVPPFVQAGDEIRVDTETGDYLERA